MMEENKIELHDVLDSDNNFTKEHKEEMEIDQIYLLPREEVIAKLELKQQELKEELKQLKEEKC